MTGPRVYLSRLRAVMAGRRMDGEMEEELRCHLAMEEEANLRRGMAPEEARRVARRDFGGMARTAEACRERRGLPGLEALARDVRLALRMCRAHPGFTAAAVVPLGVAIGFVATVLTLVNAVLFRDLGVKNPGGVATLYAYSREDGRYQSVSYPEFRDVAALGGQVESAVAYARIPVNVRLGGGVERFWSEMATGDYFRTVGVPAILGRTPGPQDDAPGAVPVAAISHALWEARFRRSRDVLGAAVTINGVAFRVVGVLPPGYAGTVLDWSPPPAFWIPLARFRDILPAMRSLDYENRRDVRWLLVSARLRGPVKELHSALDVLRARNGPGPGLVALPLVRARFFPTYRDAALRYAGVLAAISLAVLAVACFNLASLLLARASAREREIATRLALGAGASRIVQQFVVESVLLAASAIAVGLPLSLWLTHWLGSLQPVFPVPLTLNLSPDPRLLAWCAAGGMAAGVLAGIAPALRCLRTGVAGRLKGRARRVLPLRDVLVAAEVACALAMLAAAVMLAGSLGRMKTAGLGYDARNVLLATIETRSANLGEEESQGLYRTLLAELGSNRVHGAALASEALPTNIRVAREVRAVGDARPAAHVAASSVSSGYFETLRMPLEAGRGFTPADTAAAPRVVVLNRSAADLLWPGAGALGRRIRVGRAEKEVVGIVADARYHSLAESRVPYLFYPLAQEFSPQVTIHVRTVDEPMAFAPVLRRTLARLAGDIPATDVQTLERRIDGRLAPVRLAASAAAAAAFTGALLALAGLFALTACRVAQQRREIAIRLALGSHPRALLVRFAAQGLLLGLGGAAAGLVPTVWCTLRLRAALEGVGGVSAATWLFAGGALLAGMAAVSVLAARRILRVEPGALLRVQ